MTANPLSVEETLTAREARAFFIDKGISAAPVIDDAGRPVGVLSQTDLLIHDQENPRTSAEASETLVSELMTEGVFAVPRHAPIKRVIGGMCELNVHRLFVVDAAGILVGVISAMDVLRHLTQTSREGEGR